MTQTKKSLPEIKVYSTPTCPYCVTLKVFLKEQGFKYESLDVAENEAARDEMIKKSGQMGVPVIEIDGQIVVGFDREKIVRLLGIKK